MEFYNKLNYYFPKWKIFVGILLAFAVILVLIFVRIKNVTQDIVEFTVTPTTMSVVNTEEVNTLDPILISCDCGSDVVKIESTVLVNVNNNVPVSGVTIIPVTVTVLEMVIVPQTVIVPETIIVTVTSTLEPSYPNPNTKTPTGATAICNDGTYSYSQTRSGTCSYHGGVYQWLIP